MSQSLRRTQARTVYNGKFLWKVHGLHNRNVPVTYDVRTDQDSNAATQVAVRGVTPEDGVLRIWSAAGVARMAFNADTSRFPAG
ncbi:hypothetical protein Mal4_15470 [Maioricimonas rarisocia]|uniref:Uncharacterized protein n=1 Tax=Maioricimonas rarisocia TaxID=2528026 RepID=A0A517Z485_9PLAN|nr:hypothetical protein Mal4_15470 [Maioricimonas rarisocia]